MISSILIIIIILCILCIFVYYFESKHESLITKEWDTPIDEHDLQPAINRAVRHRPQTLAQAARFIPLIERRARPENIVMQINEPEDLEFVLQIILNDTLDLITHQFHETGHVGPEENFLLDLIDLTPQHPDTRPLREEDAEKRKQQAEVAAETKAEAVDLYLDATAQHVNNPQNVHDTAANAGARAIIGRIKQDDYPTIETIKNEINKRFKRSHKLATVNRVLAQFSRSNTIASLNMMSDAEILGIVWARAGHLRNSDNADAIKEAIFDNLYDCIDRHGMPLCVTGRALRIISSLAILDFDTANWKVQQVEDYKDEILTNTKFIIKEVANLGVKYGADHIRADAAEYQDVEYKELPSHISNVDSIINMLKAGDDDFITILKFAIVSKIDEYGDEKKHGYAFDQNMLEVIKYENLAAL